MLKLEKNDFTLAKQTGRMLHIGLLGYSCAVMCCAGNYLNHVGVIWINNN